MHVASLQLTQIGTHVMLHHILPNYCLRAQELVAANNSDLNSYQPYNIGGQSLAT